MKICGLIQVLCAMKRKSVALILTERLGLSIEVPFLRRPVVKDSLNKEFYDIADAVYYEVYKEHFDEVIVN